MTAAIKNHLKNSTKCINIFIFKRQKAKIFDHYSTSYRGHNINFLIFSIRQFKIATTYTSIKFAAKQA